MVALLIEHGADTNLCREQRVVVCEYELMPAGTGEADLTPEATMRRLGQGLPFFKEAPLHLALALGNHKITQQLIDVAETNLQAETLIMTDDDYDTGHRETPMVTAVRTANLPMVKALIQYQYKKDRNAVKEMVSNGYYLTPLEAVFSLGHGGDHNKDERLLIAAYLLRFGADVNYVNPFSEFKESIHHLAVRREWHEMIEFLKAVGSTNAEMPNRHGITPADMAQDDSQLKASVEKKRTEIPTLSFLVSEFVGRGSAEQAATVLESAVAGTGVFAAQRVSEYRNDYLDNYIAKLEEKLRIKDGADAMANPDG